MEQFSSSWSMQSLQSYLNKGLQFPYEPSVLTVYLSVEDSGGRILKVSGLPGTGRSDTRRSAERAMHLKQGHTMKQWHHADPVHQKWRNCAKRVGTRAWIVRTEKKTTEHRKF